MLTEASDEWELGRPPLGLPVQAFIRGRSRHGRSDGAWFRLSDCTHPLQNGIASLEEIEAWRLVSPSQHL